MVRFAATSLRAMAVLAGLIATSAAPAQVLLTENFDTITAGLPGAAWFTQNNSTTIGTAPNYFQGNDTVFPAQTGAPTAYVGVNFNSTTGANTISNWLVTPQLAGVANGTTFSFFTRTTTPGAQVFPDRLQVRFNPVGTTNVGTVGDANGVGDFTNLLLDINPTLTTTGYPNAWTQFTGTVTGLGAPVNGRFAFRYFVTDGGPTGNNSDYIGIDTLEITAVPEPGSMALCGMAVAGGVAGWRRRKTAAK